MEVQITGASTFVDRMFEAAGPWQWARELLKNSEEAGASRVEFGIEWRAVAALGVWRRAVADDGRGMGPGELLDFFSTLGLSSKKIELHGNYGVGAKIACLPWNPRGVVVCSWVAGRGSMIWICLNVKTGNYELVEFDVDGDKKIVIAPQEVAGVDWSLARPDWLVEHGTTVTLLGDDANPDTAWGHPRAGGTDLRGLSTYLNTRFWSLDVDCRVHELRTNKRERWPRSPADTADASRVNRRRVRGARHYAGLDGAAHGVVGLADGRVRAEWWLQGAERSAVHTYAREAGYIAVRYGSELYQVSASKAFYRWFGVSESEVQQRLTIVLEPDALRDGWGVYPDSSRARLMFASAAGRAEEVPLAHWAYEFADNLPEEVKAAVRAAKGATASGEIDDEYRRRLGERFGSRWSRPALIAGAGDDTGSIGMMAGSGRGSGSAGVLVGDSEDTSAGRTPEPRAPEISGAGPAAGSRKAKPVDIPRYRFASAGDFERPWHLAAWLPHEAEGPVVVVNTDSPILDELVTYWTDRYHESHAEEVGEVVRRAVGEIATCKVAHAQTLAKMLPEEVVDRDYRNERGLTLALMGLIAEDALIQQRLAGRFRRRDA